MPRATASRKSALISSSQPDSQAPANTARPRVIRVGVSRDMPVYYPGYSFSLGRLRLSAWFRAEVVYPSKDGHPPGH